MPFSVMSFFRFVMVMTSFVSFFDRCTCFCTSQTAHLSRSSPVDCLYPYRHPNQGFLRVVWVYQYCTSWFYYCTVLYINGRYERPGPTSSPVSRTTEPLRNQGFRFLYVRKYPNRTQTIPNHAIFSMKVCILFDDSRRIVSVTCPYRSKVNAAE